MEIKDGYLFLTADDEEPDCMKCDYCTQENCEIWCGPRNGWDNYHRKISIVE